MKLQDTLMVFGLLLFVTFCGGLIYGNIQKADAAKDNMSQIRAEQAKAKEIQPPVATNDRVTIELIATMEDGKVRVYRMTDYANGPFASRVCHITVGELHGKTVTMDCTG